MASILINLGLKFIGWFLDARKANAEVRASFLSFTGAMANSGLISLSLHDSYLEQQKKNINELRNPPAK